MIVYLLMTAQLRLFWRFAKLAFPYWDKVMVSFIVTTCIELGILLPPLVMRVVFDYVYPFRNFSLLILFSLIPLGLTFLLNGLTILRAMTDLFVNQNVFKVLYAQFYSKLQRLPIRFFNRHQTGDLIFRMTNDLQVIEATVLSTFPMLMSAIFKMCALILICFSMNVPLTILALIGVPFHFFQTHFFSKKLQVARAEAQDVNASLYELIEERLSNIKLIKLLHKWSTEVNQLLKTVYRMFFIERKEKITTASYSFLSTLFSKVWVTIMGIYTGYCLIHGQLTLGEVVAISSFLAMLQSPFDTIAALYSQFMVSSVSFRRVAEIMDYPAENEEKEEGKSFAIQGKIEFKKVSFGYEAENRILHDLTFALEPGRSLAIVGRSGIGKSSVIDLLLRFYTPQSGQIVVDGHPLSDINLVSLRQQIGLIAQDCSLFYGNIRDNIAFGREDKVSIEEVFEAAKLADAHDFIMELPGQYEYQVGSGGNNLSSGQRQRIAIARALLKKPKIIVFDEATAALDGESEKQIQKTLSKLHGHTTVVVIAHRLSAVKVVDQILVLGNEGRIVESGSYMELMEQKGLFYKLYEVQLGGFPQFLQQAQFHLKTLRHYGRPFSLALLEINGFDALSRGMQGRHLDHLVDDFGITVSFMLREVDIASYQDHGRFWILFPETNLSGAEVLVQNLQKYLHETTFLNLSQPLLTSSSVVQGTSEEELEELMTRLRDQVRAQQVTPGVLL